MTFGKLRRALKHEIASEKKRWSTSATQRTCSDARVARTWHLVKATRIFLGKHKFKEKRFCFTESPSLPEKTYKSAAFPSYTLLFHSMSITVVSLWKTGAPWRRQYHLIAPCQWSWEEEQKEQAGLASLSIRIGNKKGNQLCGNVFMRKRASSRIVRVYKKKSLK